MTIGVILAGGRSTRMGRDKAFVKLHGRPLIQHAIEYLAPQVDRVVINSNAAPTLFASYDCSVIADIDPNIGGPLGGIYTALMYWPNEPIVTIAVDLPFLPTDLVQRLRAENRPCRYASVNGRHVLAIRCAPQTARDLGHYLASGRRDVYGWLQTHGDAVPIERAHAINVNTPYDQLTASSM